MKKILSALLLAGILIAPLAMAEGTKIGYVDTDRIDRESAPAARALDRLKKEFQPRIDELQKLQQQGQTLKDDLDKNGMTMSDDARHQKEHDLGEISIELDRKQRDYQEDLKRRQIEEFTAVHEQAGKVIQSIGDADGYDLIVNDAIYHGKATDITDKVLKALAK